MLDINILLNNNNYKLLLLFNCTDNTPNKTCISSIQEIK